MFGGVPLLATALESPTVTASCWYCIWMGCLFMIYNRQKSAFVSLELLSVLASKTMKERGLLGWEPRCGVLLRSSWSPSWRLLSSPARPRLSRTPPQIRRGGGAFRWPASMLESESKSPLSPWLPHLGYIRFNEETERRAAHVRSSREPQPRSAAAYSLPLSSVWHLTEAAQE